MMNFKENMDLNNILAKAINGIELFILQLKLEAIQSIGMNLLLLLLFSGGNSIQI